MKSARTQNAHVFDYSILGPRACQNEIVRFVQGIRCARTQPVTADQIKKWLRRTPDEFVEEQIDALLIEGHIRCYARTLGSHRRANGAYVYELA